MKILACREAGIDCDFVAQGKTEEELMKTGAEHLKTAHNIDISASAREDRKD